MKLPARSTLIAAGTLAGLLAAGVAHLAGRPGSAGLILLVTLIAGGAPLVAATALALARGRLASDVVASLAIIGAALQGEFFAGAIVVLMQAGGEALEAGAMRRASASLESLLERAPRLARRRAGGVVTDIAVAEVVPGDELVMRPGDMVPVDGVVIEGASHVDASAITGEPGQVPARAGAELLSGSLNLEGALIVRALRSAADSQYDQIVALVRAAREEKAPIERLADRYAAWFTPATLLVCAAAWLLRGDAASVLAVLVVATPCPLILATPVAVIAGIGQAARRGIIIRHGAAIEAIGHAPVVVLDKTGTLTLGQPAISQIVAEPGHDADDVLRYAAAAEAASSHHLGQVVAREGTHRHGTLAIATDVREAAGEGIEARVEGRLVRVGSARFTAMEQAAEARDASSSAWVTIDGAPAGRITFADALRDDAAPLMRSLRALGVKRTVMLTGDRAPVARAMAAAVGIDDVVAELLPGGKVARIGDLRRQYDRVVMVGDGINDAPALAAASIGIAMGAHAPAAAAEAADIVIVADDLGRVAEAIAIGRRTRRIALQSILIGLGVSGALMIVAALGYIVPAAGAVMQEALDVAVILNALRARRPERPANSTPALPARAPAPAAPRSSPRTVSPRASPYTRSRG